MEPSSRLSTSTSGTQDTCSSESALVNASSNGNSPPKASSATANLTPAQLDTLQPISSGIKSATTPRHQNWRKTDKYFSLISTVISGPLKVSPWARSPSPEGRPILARTNTTATRTGGDSTRQKISSITTTNAVTSSSLSAPNPQETTSERANIAEGSSTQTRVTRPESPATLGKPGISTDAKLGKIMDTPLAVPHQSEESEPIVQGIADVCDSFFHPINASSQSSQGKNPQRPSQKRRASVPNASRQDIGSSGVLLSLGMASSGVQPSIAAAGGISGYRKHSLDSTAGQDHSPNSKGNKTLYIGDHKQNQRSQDINQSTLSKISKPQITKSMTRSNSVSLLGDKGDEDIGIVEIIPSSLERVPATQMSEEGHDSGIPTYSYSPVVSSSLDGSLPRGREIVSNSMDQSSSLASSPASSIKRDVSSMTSSQGRKKGSKRKKLRRSSSNGTVAESPGSSPLISSTALFEANMADIERYVDQDLYGYNNLSY